jgi:type VI secretion system secreted protein Hcp
MACDFHFNVSGVQGEDQDANFKNQIQLLSWSHGLSQQTTVAGTGGSAAGKVNVGEFSCMCYLEKSTTSLIQSICKGTHIPNATLTAVKSGANKAFFTITLSEMFVTSLQYSASSEVPAVSLSFSANQFQWEYFVQDEKGNLTSTGQKTFNTKSNQFT